MSKSSNVYEHVHLLAEEFVQTYYDKRVDPLKFQVIYQEKIEQLSLRLSRTVQAKALFTYVETSIEELKGKLKSQELSSRDEELLKVEIDILERAYNQKAFDYVKELVPFNTNIAQHAIFSARSSNKVKEGELSITANGVKAVHIKSKTGEILNTYDAQVMAAIQSLWFKKNRGKISNTLKLKYIDILNELSLTDGAKNYQRIQNSLIRLKDIEVTLTQYQSHKGAQYEEIALTRLIDQIVFRRKVDSIVHFDREFEIKLPDWLVAANENGHFFDISLVLMNDLRSYLAQGLYWLMASYTEPEFIIELETLAAHFHFLEDDQSLSLPPFKIVERISQACEELKQMGIIRNYQFTGKKRGLKERNLLVVKNTFFVNPKENKQLEINLD
ncbi:replication initiator protein A [Ammoniphilus sp. 3BR4]|uniref:replication initiator protein A n=1 Tax=Ammoniphilus sp. 3BR4 TaxID=3158265 RepID=UPI003467C2B5